MKTIVADEYQLARINGNQFSTDPKKGEKIKENVRVNDEYVERMNANSKDSGKMFVKKDKETKEYQERCKKELGEEPEKEAKELKQTQNKKS